LTLQANRSNSWLTKHGGTNDCVDELSAGESSPTRKLPEAAFFGRSVLGSRLHVNFAAQGACNGRADVIGV
jgi:hypothetical protein